MTAGTVPDAGIRLRVHARTCAGVGVLGALAHLWLAPGHGWTVGIGMVAMAAVCLPCGAGLWRRADVRAARTMMAAALAMAVLHAALLLGGSSSLPGGHGGHGADTFGAAATAVSGTVVPGHGRPGMLVLTAVELAAAFAAATLVSRLRREDGAAANQGMRTGFR